jgi:hypothetical protein
MRRLATTILAAASMLAAGVVASAAGDRTAAECSNGEILARIQSKFRHQVTHVPHLPDVDIVEFRKIHQHRYIPFGEKRPIARRYCGATAQMSDGRRRTIWYLIEDRMGFAGVGDGVEFCVSGFDRWFVYNGRCRIVR